MKVKDIRLMKYWISNLTLLIYSGVTKKRAYINKTQRHDWTTQLE